jgi:Bacterial SH3 domain/Cysteine-rich secretory protein family
VRKLAATVAIVLSTLVVVSPAAAFSWAPGASSPTAEAQVRSLIQSAHVNACGRSLAISAPMTNLARWRARDMIVRGYYDHTILGTGRHAWDYFGAYGVAATSGAEVLVWNNYPVDLSPSSAFQMWMLSAGHRAVIVSCAYDTFGVGTYQGPTGKKMFVGIFGRATRSASSAVRYVTAASLALRAGPGTGYPARAYLRAGTRLTLLRSSGAWLNVRDAAGRTGWVYSAYTRR